jgi:hypothetical protein
MSAYWTLKQLVQKFSGRAGNFSQPYPKTVENPDEEMKALLGMVNQVIRDMNREKPSPTMNGMTILRTRPYYSGTDKITDVTGATGVIVGDSTTWTTASASDYLQKHDLIRITEDGADAENAPLRVSAVGGATSATLVTWPFDDLASLTSTDRLDYEIHHDRFALPLDFGQISSAYVTGDIASRELDIKTPGELDYIKNNVQSSPFYPGVPAFITIREIASTGEWVAEIAPSPNDIYGIELNYHKILTEISSDDDTVPIPIEDGYTLLEGVLAKWNETTDTQGVYKGAYHYWLKNTLANWSVKSMRNTDEYNGIVPANMMRNPPTRSGNPMYSERGW